MLLCVLLDNPHSSPLKEICNKSVNFNIENCFFFTLLSEIREKSNCSSGIPLKIFVTNSRTFLNILIKIRLDHILHMILKYLVSSL